MYSVWSNFFLCRQIIKVLILEFRENGTVEERVTLLEIQMDEVQGEVSQNEGNISLLFTLQIVQDERLVDLEDDTSGLEQSVESKITNKTNYN